MFHEPFNSPSDKNYSTISLLLSRFISQQISYEECYKTIDQITQDCKPLKKLKTILDVPPQPLPSDSDSDSTINYLSFQDTSQAKHQTAPLSVLSTTKKKCQNWSTAEDDRLICGIIRFGFDNWTTIANFVGNNRTRSQCNQRWARGLDPHISRDQWTSEESQKLINLVQVHGEKSWTHIASVMGNRSDIQCRYHFYQLTKRSRGYSFSNDANNNSFPKVFNGSTRQSTPSINMPNYILPMNFSNNYANKNSNTNSTDPQPMQPNSNQNFFEPPPLSRPQKPFPNSQLCPRMSAPTLQKMPQIMTSSASGINFPEFNSMNHLNNTNMNNISNMNNMNSISNTNSNISNNTSNINMISNSNMNPANNMTNINNNNNTMNNLNTSNSNMNNNLNGNIKYPPFFPQAQQGPPMPQLKGFPRLNQFNQQQQVKPTTQDPFFDTPYQTNSSNVESMNNANYNSVNYPNNTATTSVSNEDIFSAPPPTSNNNNNKTDNNYEEDDIDTVFQFASKYSGVDDFVDENGSWAVDRYKGYDVSREKYENEFIF